MGQLGIRIINIVLFTTSCFFSAGVFNHIADHQLAPDYVSTMKPTARAVSREPNWQERSAILDRNLFGAKVAGSDKPKAKPKPPPPPPEEEAKETKLPIELLGTVAVEPVELSTAAINNTRAKKHQVVSVGDVLEGFDEVTVTSIEPGRVLLRNRNVIEELLLEKEDGKKQARAGNPRASRGGRGALQRLRDRQSRRRNSRTEQPAAPASAAEAEDEAMKMIQGAMAKTLIRDLEPAYDDGGQITGVKVGEIEPDGVLSRAGLQADDVIVSLNGIDINSAGAAARVMREMSKCKPMTGSVDGAAGNRTIEIGRDLLAELNCP